MGISTLGQWYFSLFFLSFTFLSFLLMLVGGALQHKKQK